MSALSHVYPDRACGSGRRSKLSSGQTWAALVVSVAAGLAIFATAVGSLMAGAAAAPPAAKSPPPGWIDLAFADVGAASVGSAVHPQQDQVVQPQDAQKQNAAKPNARKPDPCADFVYYFLNTNCSVKRVSAARRPGFTRRAVAARTLPAPKQVSVRDPDRVTFAATTTTATD